MVALPPPQVVTPVTAECIDLSARAAKIPPVVLAGILAQENGKVGQRRKNKNGTFDYGPMQINSVWLPTLAKYGIPESAVLNNGCVNVYVGAWILRSHVNDNNNDMAKAIGAYHSKTPGKRDRYLATVAKRIVGLMKGDLPVQKVISNSNGKKFD